MSHFYKIKNKYKIKSCPFCGEIPSLWKNSESGLIKIMCTNTDCGVYSSTNEVPPAIQKDLIGIWNQRIGKI